MTTTPAPTATYAETATCRADELLPGDTLVRLGDTIFDTPVEVDAVAVNHLNPEHSVTVLDLPDHWQLTVPSERIAWVR